MTSFNSPRRELLAGVRTVPFAESAYMDSSPRFLTALPVYNEVSHVNPVLDEVVRYAGDVLVVDDGSTDGTSDLLAARKDIHVIRHEKNRGYGAALITAFEYAVEQEYDVLVTIDCDGQHEPQRICQLVAACAKRISFPAAAICARGSQPAPAERRQINTQITRELNERLGAFADRCVLRLQGVSRAGACEALDHRAGLRDADRSFGCRPFTRSCGLSRCRCR